MVDVWPTQPLRSDPDADCWGWTCHFKFKFKKKAAVATYVAKHMIHHKWTKNIHYVCLPFSPFFSGLKHANSMCITYIQSVSFPPDSSRPRPLLKNHPSQTVSQSVSQWVSQSACASELRVVLSLFKCFSVPLLLCMWTPNCALMCIGNDKDILYLWTTTTSSRIL